MSEVFVVAKQIGVQAVPSRIAKYHKEGCSSMRTWATRTEYKGIEEEEAINQHFIPCPTCYGGPRIKKSEISGVVYPVKTMIPIWTTADGREFGNEVDALRQQLDLERKVKKRAEKAVILAEAV